MFNVWQRMYVRTRTSTVLAKWRKIPSTDSTIEVKSFGLKVMHYLNTYLPTVS